MATWGKTSHMISCGVSWEILGWESGERGSSSLISLGPRQSDLNSDGQPYYVHVKTASISMLHVRHWLRDQTELSGCNSFQSAVVKGWMCAPVPTYNNIGKKNYLKMQRIFQICPILWHCWKLCVFKRGRHAPCKCQNWLWEILTLWLSQENEVCPTKEARKERGPSGGQEVQRARR